MNEVRKALFDEIMQIIRKNDDTTLNQRVHEIIDVAQAAHHRSARDGWKLVPVEPDEYMLNAGMSAFCVGGRVFQSMVEAAPQPPQEGEGDE